MGIGHQTLQQALDRPLQRPKIAAMKTLTITEAKKNLGKCLSAAAKGEEIGIISGSDLIALRKVRITAVEEDPCYSQREYGVSTDELNEFSKRMKQEYTENPEDFLEFSSKEELSKALEIEN